MVLFVKRVGVLGGGVMGSQIADIMALNGKEVIIRDISEELVNNSYSQIEKNLNDLVDQNQLGLVMLKTIEIIGEDNIGDLDPETIYFLNKILNKLNLKKIRNNILSEVLPVRV